MPKTIHRQEYQVLLQLLRLEREKAGLTQVECSIAIGRSQSFISDVERGTRRLDLIQLRDLCNIFGISLIDFVSRFEKSLKG